MAINIQQYLDVIAGEGEGEEVILAIHDAALRLQEDAYKTADIETLLNNIKTKPLGKDIRMDIHEMLKRLSETQIEARELYGLKIAKNNPDPEARCTYLYDAAGFTPMQCQSDGSVTYGSWTNAFFMRNNYPAMYKLDGSFDYKLLKANHAYKENGTTASDITNDSYAGNALSVFDCHIWMKFWEDSNYQYIEVSNWKVDDDFVDWPYILDDGTKSSKLFYPMFEGRVIDGKLRSIGTAQKPTCDTTAEQELTAARANDGLGEASLWSIGDWSHHLWLTCLSMLVGKTTCVENALGAGNTSGYYGESGVKVNGLLMDKGAFWGKVQTGTSQDVNSVKLFYIENPYANRWKRTLGLYNANGTYYVKTSPPYTVDESYDAYENCGALPNDNGYVKDLKITSCGLLPSTVGGSGTTYVGANHYHTNNEGYRTMLMTGGRLGDDYGCGFWYLGLFSRPTAHGWNMGASVYLKREKSS